MGADGRNPLTDSGMALPAATPWWLASRLISGSRWTTWNSRALLHHKLAVQRCKVAEVRPLMAQVDILSAAGGLRRRIACGAAEGAAGGLAVFVSAAVMNMISIPSDIVVAGRAQRATLMDKEAPHRELVV